MYYFNVSYKSKVLQGRTIRYLANEKLYISEEYLGQILLGKTGCSLRLANDIVEVIGENEKLEDYFVIKED